jgi:F-type H+-transporting ATPase subunit gamma
MRTLESLKRQIDGSRQLQNVVKTMKTIAAAGIRRFEQCVESVAVYRQTVETGMQVLLRRERAMLSAQTDHERHHTMAIVFGSAQGMCGRFNEDVVAFAADDLGADVNADRRTEIVSAGDRLSPLLATRRITPVNEAFLPSSVHGINRGVQDILSLLDKWIRKHGFARVLLYHNRKKSGTSYRPRKTALLPLDTTWMKELADREWPSGCLPMFRMSRDALFAGLIRQHIYVSLYQAFAESLAAENSSRLAAMQAAESNIEEHLEELESKHNHLRQDSITSELLDIASGYEALHEEGD